MSKIEAYKCDNCGRIEDSQYMTGVQRKEDLFNKLDSYPSGKCKDCDIHYCVQCYAEHVLKPAENGVDRKNDEPGYKSLIKSLSFNLRKQSFLKWLHNSKKHAKKA